MQAEKLNGNGHNGEHSGQERPAETSPIGEVLRQARTASSKSLKQLADQLHYARAYLSAVELGHKKASRSLVEGYERELELPEGSLTRLLGRQPSSAEAQEVTEEEAIIGSDAFVDEVLQTLAKGVNAPRLAVPTVGPETPSDEGALGPGDLKVIIGRTNVHDAALNLISTAIRETKPGEEPILLAYETPLGVRRGTVQDALERGWQVSAVYRPHFYDDSEWLKKVASALTQAIVGGSRFSAYVVDKDSTCMEAMVVPGRSGGALLLLEIQGGAGDAAYHFEPNRHGLAIEALRDHLRYAIGESQPLLTVYDFEHVSLEAGEERLPVNRLGFNSALSVLPEGNTYLKKDGLSILRLLPVAIDEARAERILMKRGPEWYALARTLVEQRSKQMKRFANLLSRGYQCFDLVSKPGIDVMVERGIIRDDWLAEPLTLIERLRYLSYAIKILKHPNYHIGFLDEPPPVYYLVADGEATGKAEGTVYLEAFREEGHEIQEYDIAVRDRIFAAAFRQDIVRTFEQLTPDRGKDAVLDYLNQKVALLEAQVASLEQPTGLAPH